VVNYVIQDKGQAMPLDSYYAVVPPERLARLRQIEAAVRQVAPDAEASLEYKMPTFRTPKGWTAFANQKHHISVYTCSAEKLAPYLEAHPDVDCGKGCLRFRDGTEIDFEALAKVFVNALL